MLQEIAPLWLDNSYSSRQAAPTDSLLVFRDQELLMLGDGEIRFPSIRDVEGQPCRLTYLFSIGETGYFRTADADSIHLNEQVRFIKGQELRSLLPRHLVFAGVLGLQLHRWYQHRRYCGCCGLEMQHDGQERAMNCVACDNKEYPQLMPAVIVGVVSGNSLLLTRYAGRVRPNWALVAGYTEAGESLEECVAREVLEEVGLEVADISYYKSQPWPFSGSLLVGYFARVKGSEQIRLDERELSEARFFDRSEIDVVFDGVALTNEMICAFRAHGPDKLLYRDPIRQAPFKEQQ